jgi:hypothetical protein
VLWQWLWRLDDKRMPPLGGHRDWGLDRYTPGFFAIFFDKHIIYTTYPQDVV